MTAKPRLVLIAAIAGLATTIGLLWLADVPLGVPGEWTWPRIAYSAEHVWGWMAAGVSAVIYVCFVAAAATRIEQCGRFARSVWLVSLAAAGMIWLAAVQSAVPGIAGLPKTHFVTYYQGSSGYFWQARYDVDETREFLAGYEDLLAERDFLHIGTHPPGLTLLFRGLLAMCELSPAMTDVVLATEPAASREVAQTIRANERISGRELRRVDEAVLWLAAVLAMAAAAATVVPLYVLLTECADRRTAWFAAALWPLVPGIAVFLPKSDAVFPLISVLGPTLWFVGWRRRSLLCCCLAGLTLLGGMLLSLAIAPIAVLTGLATVLHETVGHVQGAPRADRRWWMVSVTVAAAGFFIPVLLLWWTCNLNLPRVWSWNVANHALFYEHNTRTWWKWLLVNPIEAGLAAGGPLTVVAMIGAIRSRRTRLFPLIASTAVVWGLLWISGKNMGEAARLWLLLQPWVVVAAAGAFGDRRAAERDAQNDSQESRGAADRSAWFALLTIQAIACIATVTRIDGFDLQLP